jgi:hypothetical protein
VAYVYSLLAGYTYASHTYTPEGADTYTPEDTGVASVDVRAPLGVQLCAAWALHSLAWSFAGTVWRIRKESGVWW